MIPAIDLSFSFELHLLESGISGLGRRVMRSPSMMFELHLLESGISGTLQLEEGSVATDV